jgi:hypothetical protein
VRVLAVVLLPLAAGCLFPSLDGLSRDSGTDAPYDDVAIEAATDAPSIESGIDAASDVTPPPPPITFVQVAATDFGANLTGQLAFATDVTAHDAIIACATFDNTSATLSLSDSLGSSFTTLLGPVDVAASSRRHYLFAALDVAGGSDTITATLSAAAPSRFEVYIHEYANVSAYDVGRAAIGTSASMTSGTMNLSGSNELLFGYAWSSDTVTVGSGFTARSTAYSNVTEDMIVTSAGSYEATASQNSNAWAMLAAAFK